MLTQNLKSFSLIGGFIKLIKAVLFDLENNKALVTISKKSYLDIGLRLHNVLNWQMKNDLDHWS